MALFDVVVWHKGRKTTDTVTGDRSRAIRRAAEVERLGRGEPVAAVIDDRGIPVAVFDSTDGRLLAS